MFFWGIFILPLTLLGAGYWAHLAGAISSIVPELTTIVASAARLAVAPLIHLIAFACRAFVSIMPEARAGKTFASSRDAPVA